MSTLSMNCVSSPLPDIFCWTKMGTEAGQPLQVILRRKELERRAGNGTFAWGIGSSLGTSADFAKQVTPNGDVDILFSPMKSSPRNVDICPAQLVLWLSYYVAGVGLVDLPNHMLVTSRGGGRKRSHYALLCQCDTNISTEEQLMIIDAKYARNLVSLNPLGASQVTAMVRYCPENVSCPENPYPVSFRAKMYKEGFVRLGSPILLVGSLLAHYRAICEKARSAHDWLSSAVDLKCQARSAQAFQQQSDLFAA